ASTRLRPRPVQPQVRHCAWTGESSRVSPDGLGIERGRCGPRVQRHFISLSELLARGLHDQGFNRALWKNQYRPALADDGADRLAIAEAGCPYRRRRALDLADVGSLACFDWGPAAGVDRSANRLGAEPAPASSPPGPGHRTAGESRAWLAVCRHGADAPDGGANHAGRRSWTDRVRAGALK